MILDIFSLSGNTPDDKDELMIDTRVTRVTRVYVPIDLYYCKAVCQQSLFSILDRIN